MNTRSPHSPSPAGPHEQKKANDERRKSESESRRNEKQKPGHDPRRAPTKYERPAHAPLDPLDEPSERLRKSTE